MISPDPAPGTALRPRTSALVGALLATVVLPACTTVKVKTESGRLARDSIASAKLLRTLVDTPVSVVANLADTTGQILGEARHLDKKGQTDDAAARYLIAAIDAHALLAARDEIPGSEAEKALLQLHNSSLARFAELWADDPRRMSGEPVRLQGENGPLEVRVAATSAFAADYFDRLVAAGSVAEKGIVRRTRDGIGAALVGVREQTPERAEEMRFYPKRGLMLPVTLTLDAVSDQPAGAGRLVTLSIRNPLTHPEARLAGRDWTLATDVSAPLAMLLAGQSEAKYALDGFFKANERIRSAGLYLTEPYDPRRIPIILTHGLVSVPIIWRNVVPEIMVDPEISRRYQFLVFTYPTSYPIVQSAKLFRDQLAAVRAQYDPDGNDLISRDVVAIGHSMGGILTHTLVTDFGDRYWRQFSDTPFDQLPLAPEKKEALRPLVFFEPDPGVTRAIFIATPHRGSKSADKGLAQLISRAADLPAEILETTADLLDPEIATNVTYKIDPHKKTTAVQSLQPGAPMVSALDISPFKPGVIYHSIIGDRGKGDTPHSSDGVVEYWSSHQDGAASELIVPTDHGAYKSPLAIEEIHRILREHAGI